MGIFVDRDRLPSGLSYPLKRSHLDKALSDAGIRSVFRIDYWRIKGEPESCFICGHDRSWSLLEMGSRKNLNWSPHKAAALVAATVFGVNDPYGRDAECTITINSIASTRRHKAETLFLDYGLEKLVEWISTANTYPLDATWRSADHHFAFALTADDDWHILTD